jgi:hypothetical protein
MTTAARRRSPATSWSGGAVRWTAGRGMSGWCTSPRPAACSTPSRATRAGFRRACAVSATCCAAWMLCWALPGCPAKRVSGPTTPRRWCLFRDHSLLAPDQGSQGGLDWVSWAGQGRSGRGVSTWLRSSVLSQRQQIEVLHLFASPRCLAKKAQAGRNAGVVREAADWDSSCEFIPSIVGLQGTNHGFQCHAMQGVARLLGWRWWIGHGAIVTGLPSCRGRSPLRRRSASPAVPAPSAARPAWSGACPPVHRCRRCSQ